VTHGISYLLHVDSILVMKDGELSERGSFQQLIDHAGAFSGFLKTYFLKGDDQKISDEGNIIYSNSNPPLDPSPYLLVFVCINDDQLAIVLFFRFIGRVSG